ncbi:segregation/condensation protein A [Halobacillus sp. Marseille-P3879]|uniref:segregation/condensation protein A n=1 Tax=Halobacillus sp. Marseille-P3879 TaxID=2045014 RepID=UPI000C7CEE1D|nr:segregation/condensation protein A [Halobacillus sp. Marseille-P3879]
MTDRYQVKLEQFEGPLDLLLHLINRYEIDIYDIPVSTITEQYMNYIHTMQELELNIASEYLVMAATLVAIKSQMLLPAPSLDDEFEEQEEDPREELISRLVEYKKYKKAAEDLKNKELEENRIYTRPQMIHEETQEEPEVKAGEASVFEMVAAVQQLLRSNKQKPANETKIKRDEVSIQLRMEDILNKITVSTGGTRFYDLFEERTRSHVVVSFIAILELMKSNEIVCTQSNHFEELMVYRLLDNHDV